MKLTSRIANSLRGRRDGTPQAGRLVYPRPQDRWRDYPGDGLTPSRLARILKAADDGALDEAMQLYEQMEEKDAHLFSVAHTRRLALTGLDWQVVSAADVRGGVSRQPAEEAAAYCQEVLAGLHGFEETLQHLSLALGRNLAVTELVWDVVGGRHELVELVPVDFTRLTFGETGEVRILTKEEPYEGIALPPNKFVVHTPHTASGHPSRGGLLRVTALAFIGKQYALKDWLVYAEVFGMPVRVARYEPSATPAEKRELLEMLQSLGTDAAGLFSKAVDLEIVQAGKGASQPPYEAMANFFNREMSKAWLGQTLTSDTAGATGTFATAEIHDRVRQDLRDDDIRKEGRMVRGQILRPLVQMRFGGGAAVPFFRRRLRPAGSLKELAGLLSSAVNDLGLRVPASWAHESLGIPQAAGAEAVVPGGGE